MPTPLAVATLGVLLTSLGWGLGARVILGHDFLAVYQRVADDARTLRTWPQPANPTDVAWELESLADSAFVEPFRAFVTPVRHLFQLKAISFREFVFYVFGTLWMFAVWAAAGGVIVRSAVVRFAWDQSPDPWQTLQFVAERFVSYFSAPLYPLFGVGLLMLPLFVAGLLARFDFGALFVSMFWFLGLLCSLAAVWLLIPLMFGFPLMWGAISTERDGDAFEALSNSIAYTYQRPLKYLGYATIALLLGALSLVFVDGAARLIVYVGYWGLSWGSGAERALEIQRLATEGGDASRVLSAGGWLFGFWTSAVYLLAAGFRYSFFWTISAGIYLLLRKDVDDKEIDEVYLAHEEPQLTPVSRGMAVAKETAAAPTSLASAPTETAVSPGR